MGMFDGLANLGGVFDTGGDGGQTDQMQTAEEQGGWFSDLATTLGGASFGGQANLPPVEPSGGIGGRLVQTFIHSKVETFFDGPEFGETDLLTYDAPDGGGWVPSVGLTATGKKWGLLVIGAAAVFWVMGRR